MRAELSVRGSVSAPTIVTATLAVETRGEGFFEITSAVAHFLKDIEAGDGMNLLFMRHTSASLVIQENADPDVRTDLVTALHRLAPADAGWVHTAEGPDDMPGHVKSMLAGISLHVPVIGGKLALGTWQGIYVAEHRARPHRREVILQFIGAKKGQAPLPGARDTEREGLRGIYRQTSRFVDYWIRLRFRPPQIPIAQPSIRIVLGPTSRRWPS